MRASSCIAFDEDRPDQPQGPQRPCGYSLYAIQLGLHDHLRETAILLYGAFHHTYPIPAHNIQVVLSSVREALSFCREIPSAATSSSPLSLKWLPLRDGTSSLRKPCVLVLVC